MLSYYTDFVKYCGPQIELIFTLKILGVILWVHTIQQSTVCNIKGHIVGYCISVGLKIGYI